MCGNVHECAGTCGENANVRNEPNRRRAAPSLCPCTHGERAGERGERCATSVIAGRENPHPPASATASRPAAPLAPLPCPLPGVPGRGRRECPGMPHLQPNVQNKPI